MYASQLTGGYADTQRFHSFSQLPLEIRNAIWHYAYAFGAPGPGVQFFEVCKTPRTSLSFHRRKAAASPTREICTVGSYQSIWTVEGRPRATRELDLTPRSMGCNGGSLYGSGGVSSYWGNYGILNACRESREAALWCAQFLQGNSHLALSIPSLIPGGVPCCITIDVAQDLICLLPHWLCCSAWEGGGPSYKFSLLKNLRAENPGHAVTRLAMEWEPLMLAGTVDEEVAPGEFHRRRTFQPFIVQMLAHLKRETFVEADYPLPEQKEGEDNDKNANGYIYDAASESFEVNHGFNTHFEFKGKFYLIDESIALKDPSKLQNLERCRKPEFVCGRRKYYKVARKDKFFDVGACRRLFSMLEDLERAVLRHEYGNIPVDMPSWGVLNPMDSFGGTSGCSLYALAVVDSRT